jgi:hypothetical protein
MRTLILRNTTPLRLALAGALILMLAGTTTPLGLSGSPAHWAQRHRPAAPMASGDVTALLQKRGYRDVSAVRRKGAHFVVQATGSRGEQVTLVVDGLTGEISGLRRR